MEYKLIGEPFPALLLHMSAGEDIFTQKGAMIWQDDCIRMETTSNGGIGKVFGRVFTGESMFINRYVAQGDGELALGTSFAGTVIPFEVVPGKNIIVQKRGFLAHTSGIKMETFFQKKFGSGLFGGEGFIMQKFTGSGMVFVEIDGYAVKYELAAGQRKLIDTGYLAVMDETCSIDVVSTGSVRNALFGGEGLFNTVVTGPGTIWLQTKPICSLADSLKPYLPSSGS